MNRRKSAVLGLAAVCALAFTAFAAPSSAFAVGTTAFTCIKNPSPTAGTKMFSDAHCKVESSTGEFGHQAFTGSTPIQISATETGTTKSRQILTSSFLGIEVELESTEIEVMSGANNTLENVASNPMEVKGEVMVTYKGVKVLKPSVNCGVKDEDTAGTPVEMVSTKQLKAHSSAMGVVFEPTAGTTFATVTLTNCGLATGSHNITGSVTGTPEGATMNFLAINEHLEFGGNAATYTGKQTVTNATTGNPIAVTTEGE